MVTMSAPPGVTQGTVQSEFGDFPILNGRVSVDSRCVIQLTNAGFQLVLGQASATQADIANAVSGLASAADLAALGVSMAAAVSSRPLLSTKIPESENMTPAIGNGGSAARDNHVHQRLSETVFGTLGANGLVTVQFAREYTARPGMALLSLSAGAAITWDVAYIKTGAVWTGATIQGFRSRQLPTLSVLLTDVVTKISAFDVFTPAAGVSFCAIVIVAS